MECAGCGQDLHLSEFSRNQRSKGEGQARCKLCVQECVRKDDGPVTARENFATRISYGSLAHPWASGTFRYVQKGTYTGGERTGQPCVIKWFKDPDANLDTDYYDNEERVADEAIRIVDKFNDTNIVDKLIRVNRPDTWKFSDTDDPNLAGRYFSVEPFIERFCKFNSNTGWVNDDDTDWVDVMQALSHFSYAHSSGTRLLCDLQGGIYRDGAILTDPVVMSDRAGKFGPTDLGTEGISSFFAHHTCGRYCRKKWPVPRYTEPVFRRTAGTTMQGPAHVSHAGYKSAKQLRMTYDDSDSDSD